MSYRNHRAHRDRNHGPIAKRLEEAGIFVVDLSSVGGGCPDLLCYNRSLKLLRLIEIKNPQTTPKTHRLSEAERKRKETEIKQEAFRSIVRSVAVVMSEEAALEAMGVRLAEARPSSETRAIRKA